MLSELNYIIFIIGVILSLFYTYFKSSPEEIMTFSYIKRKIYVTVHTLKNVLGVLIIYNLIYLLLSYNDEAYFSGHVNSIIDTFIFDQEVLLQILSFIFAYLLGSLTRTLFEFTQQASSKLLLQIISLKVINIIYFLYYTLVSLIIRVFDKRGTSDVKVKIIGLSLIWKSIFGVLMKGAMIIAILFFSSLPLIYAYLSSLREMTLTDFVMFNVFSGILSVAFISVFASSIDYVFKLRAVYNIVDFLPEKNLKVLFNEDGIDIMNRDGYRYRIYKISIGTDLIYEYNIISMSRKKKRRKYMSMLLEYRLTKMTNKYLTDNISRLRFSKKSS